MTHSRWIAALLGTEAERRPLPGVTVATVVDNQDPELLGRVRVSFPWLPEGEDPPSAWARLATPMAGPGRGMHFLPEIDDQVLVAFAHGDPDFPYVLGALWNTQAAPPETDDDSASRRTLVTPGGHTLRFDDREDGESLEIVDARGKQRIVLDTAAGTLTIEADQGITIEAKQGRLTLKGQGITLDSGDDVSIRSSRDLEVTAGGQLKARGTTIHLN